MRNHLRRIPRNPAEAEEEMKSKRQLEDAVVRAAMRYFRQYGNWYYENGRRADTGTKLCEACARLAARRRKRG